jgi:hypothetical protein
MDANQSSRECFCGSSIKPYTVEWLKVQRGLEAPFISLTGYRPNSTTVHPQRDTDYILTFGISAINVSTLNMNLPAHSDHLGILPDLDLAVFFSSKFSSTHQLLPRILNAGNKTTVDSYVKYSTEQITKHKILERLQVSFDLATKSPPDTRTHKATQYH